MAASPFGFFRGAAPVMAYDLSLGARTGIDAQLCGDAHVQNLGAYAAPDGALVFDINDFDETMRGPFEWDVKRLATSILLAGSVAKLKPTASGAAATAFLGSYCRMMQRFSTMPVLEAARYQVRRLGAIEPIASLLRKAERETPLLTLARLTRKGKHGRTFRSEPPLLRPLLGKDAAAVLACLPLYTHSLLPERKHFLTHFKAMAVAFKVVGTGSVGLRDYCIYLEGNGPRDPMFLQIKQEALSVYAPYLPTPAPGPVNEGRRVVEGQRAMQLESDSMLGYTEFEGGSYLVRQLNDHKASLDVATLSGPSLVAYAQVCGELLARGHARSGDAGVLAGYLGKGEAFTRAILEFAQSYVKQTTADWRAFAGKK